MRELDRSSAEDLFDDSALKTELRRIARLAVIQSKYDLHWLLRRLFQKGALYLRFYSDERCFRVCVQSRSLTSVWVDRLFESPFFLMDEDANDFLLCRRQTRNLVANGVLGRMFPELNQLQSED